MQAGIISSRALAEFGRMDAGFHLLNKEHEERIAQLKRNENHQAAVDHAISLFNAINPKHRKLLSPLVRGGSSGKPFSNEQLLKAATEYPYHTIAVIEANAGAISDDLREQIKEMNAQADSLEQRIEILRNKDTSQ